jgi:hypothetical protein
VALDHLDQVPPEDPPHLRRAIGHAGLRGRRNPGARARVILSTMIARLAAVVAAAVPCMAAPAAAGTLADALARGDAAAIAELRERAGDPGARCTLGAIYARRGELARAGFFLADCTEAALPAEIAEPVDRAARDTPRRLEAGGLVMIKVMSTPAGIPAESDALPGEPFTTPATLWARPGSYEVRAQVGGVVRTYAVQVEPRKHAAVVIDAPAPKPPPEPRDQAVSFEVEALGEQETAPPPDIKHPTLLPKKYRGAVALGEAGGGPGGEAGGGPGGDGGDGGGPQRLVDPLAARQAVRRPRAHWLGARVSGGMFDDGRAAARAGLAAAVAGRYGLATGASGGPAVFLALRADAARRGGRPEMPGAGAASAEASIGVLGAAAGAGVTVLDRGGLSIALIGQLRAELRLASARAGEPIRRGGLGAAAGAELALPGSPITCGLRLEHGLTELVSGARDRALLLELGVDWR